jgi:hypothetical protein
VKSSIIAGMLAMAVILLLSWPQIAAVWADGRLSDTDDAMRMAQIRDWMAGQNWFDLRQYRLAPPDGAPMHWTRVVDVQVALLLHASGFLFEPARAEIAARLAYMFILFALMLWGAARLGRTLAGSAGALPAMALIATSALMFGHMQFGRVDHHALQMVLLLFAWEAAVRALDERAAYAAAIVGALVALSISVGVETALMLAGACGLAPLNWVMRGAPARKALLWLAISLSIALLLCGVMFIAASTSGQAACDALSPAFIFAGLSGAGAIALLYIASPCLTNWQTRLGALVCAGAGALGAVLLAYPACAVHPYATMDPLVRAIWFDNMPEGLPFSTMLAQNGTAAIAFVPPIVLGALSLGFAIWKTQGLARRRWMAIGAAFAISCATLALEVRALTQVATLGYWGAVFVAIAFARRMQAPLLSIAPVIFISPLFWAMMKAVSVDAPVEAPSSQTCYLPDSYRTLAALPQGLVLAPINLGGHIIAHTHHSALGGAYHRISKQNRALLEMLLARPHEARKLLRAAGVRYVALCFDADTLATIIQHGPESLAAALMRDQAALDWLRKSGPMVEPLRIYEVR